MQPDGAVACGLDPSHGTRVLQPLRRSRNRRTRRRPKAEIQASSGNDLLRTVCGRSHSERRTAENLCSTLWVQERQYIASLLQSRARLRRRSTTPGREGRLDQIALPNPAQHPLCTVRPSQSLPCERRICARIFRPSRAPCSDRRQFLSPTSRLAKR